MTISKNQGTSISRQHLVNGSTDTLNDSPPSINPSDSVIVQPLKIDRPFYEQEQLNNELEYCKPKSCACKNAVKKLKEFDGRELFMQTFPVVRMFSQYSWKNDFAGDLISGCTVAVMHIPQGMGYALLASVPPIVGLYMAFFPVLVYFIFGTSRHNSMGTFAVISIMVGKSVLAISNEDYTGAVGGTVEAKSLDGNPVITRMQVATAVCFLVGVIQLIMYLFRLGIISSLLSETLVSGFTTGAAIHVFTSQVKDLIGVSIPPITGYFEIINTYSEIFKEIHNINTTAIIITVITVIILVINNEWLKEKLSKKTAIPFPIELILVVCGTLISKYMDLEASHGITVIGNIPTGFPEPKIPDFSLFSKLVTDCFTIAMVAYTVSVSMGLIFAQKYNYEIDYNQELLAMGAGNVFGSFFSCVPFAASLSRSMIQAGVGGKTQIASIISCMILTTVLLWIGPFFEVLPKCVLASIIVVSLKGLFMQVKQFVTFYKLSCLDAVVWMATFLTVVLVAIDIGLLVGIVLSLCCIFIRGMKPYTCLLGNVPRTDLYLDITRYKAAEEIKSIKIFHYCGSLNFASRNSFKSTLCETLNIDLAKETRKRTNALKKEIKYEPISFKTLILDFSALSYIDPSGTTSLKLLVREFNNLDVIVYLAGSSCPVYEMMKKCELLTVQSENFKIFPTVHDAVHYSTELSSPIDVFSIRL